MHETILDVMRQLGEAGIIFGAENPQKGESEFQIALGDNLSRLTQADGWSWSYGRLEERFKTAALKNKEAIEVDLVGHHPSGAAVAIELKYVPSPPKDRYAFPWDILKDCLKLDLLRGQHCTPALPRPDKLQTYVVAMTNWPEYWRGTSTLAWATNFVQVMRAPTVRFEGLIETKGGNPDNTMFAQGRCHIALGRCWSGTWRDERRQHAIDKAQAALDKAGQEHAKRAAVIQAEVEAVEKKSQAEKARWDKEKERFEAALRRAQG